MVPAAKKTLIQNLQNPSAYNHPVTDIEVIETHISWVLLTGEFAYKIKKPVRFPFADFSTLEKRRFYCREELRLNSRLAPSFYLDVVPITGTLEQPVMNGPGEPIEFAVKMRQFPPESLLSLALQRNSLIPEDIDRLACNIAEFHQRSRNTPPKSQFGTPTKIQQAMQENFQSLVEDVEDPILVESLQALREWSEAEFDRFRKELQTRQQQGFVRECHGDLHTGNMFLLESPRQIVVFDGIDFNEDLRWIDVISDAAFCVMDLADWGRADLAHRFLNAYLEATGDYAGLTLAPFYLVYRAMVRAKVADIRLHQQGLSGDEIRRQQRDLAGYVELAKSYTHPSPPHLLITHGPSGSGKTFATQSLIDNLGAIRIRSDVERKRMHQPPSHSDSNSDIAKNLYSPEISLQTYAHLSDLALSILQNGFTVVVDATFLMKRERNQFHALANQLAVPFHILSFQVSRATLERRIRSRQAQENDASDADVDVLAWQLKTLEPLGENEAASTIVVNTDNPDQLNELLKSLSKP